jgi:hypothetical protein
MVRRDFECCTYVRNLCTPTCADQLTSSLKEHVRTVVANYLQTLPHPKNKASVFTKDIPDDVERMTKEVQLLVSSSGLPEISDALVSYSIKRCLERLCRLARNKLKAGAGSVELDAAQSSVSEAPRKRGRPPSKTTKSRTTTEASQSAQ